MLSDLRNNSKVYMCLMSRGLTPECINSTINKYEAEALKYTSIEQITEFLFMASHAVYGSRYALSDLVDLNRHNYLLIEDTMSGMDFWKWILDSINININLINPTLLGQNSGGLGSLCNCLDTVYDTTNTYYILYDDDSTNRNIWYQEQVSKLHVMCEASSNLYLLDDYVGLESIFIGCPDLYDWALKLDTSLNLPPEVVYGLEAYSNKLHDEPYNMNDYITVKYRYRKDKSKLLSDNDVYRYLISDEKLGTELLKELFRLKRLAINKNSIGNCWWEACCTIPYQKCTMEQLKITNKLLEVFNKSYYKKNWGALQ